jgi:hypothetical protein
MCADCRHCYNFKAVKLPTSQHQHIQIHPKTKVLIMMTYRPMIKIVDISTGNGEQHKDDRNKTQPTAAALAAPAPAPGVLDSA